ncbi:MAG: alpha-L-rhamnosidase [Ktedonobacteraceae bacterium]
MTAVIRPVRLRCEYLENPLGIDAVQPRLSWQLEAVQVGQRALRQTAYQVLVASSKELLAASTADLWDSGRVVTDQSSHIVYAGVPLATGQQCWWQVRVWDNNEEASAYSAPASWEMGLLHNTDWQGQWIGLRVQGQQEQQYDQRDRQLLIENPGLTSSPYLRKATTLVQPVEAVRRARLYITARGLYEAHINGQRVGNAFFTPGWTDYTRRIQYQTYDAGALLQAGENVIGIILGAGWYSGHVGFTRESSNYHHYGQAPSMLLQLHIEYSDGSSQLIVSDEGWRGRNGPIVYSDLLAGETYDARHELPGWDTAAYVDSAWWPVTVEARDGVPLVAQPDQPVRVTETLKPQSMHEVTPGVFIYDMGQNMVGWARLRIQSEQGEKGEPGKAGTRVQLRFAEMLNPDGTLYTTNLRSARQTDTYILKGDEVETFEPHFTFHGFRYVELSGYPAQPTLATISGCVAHSDTPPAGKFECSNQLVNQLQRNIVWGQRGNFLSVPTDCPQRDERLGWLGDAQIFVHTACYNMDVAAFFTKWMNDVVDGQSEAGGFPDVAPRLVVKVTDAAPAWGEAGIIVPWTIYQMYGDTRILEQHYAAMAAWVAYLHEANPDLLWVNKRHNDYGDWLSIQADTPKDVLATAYFAYDALLMTKIARVLGRRKDAEKYQALFNGISSAFREAYVAEDGRIKGDTQTCYLLALHMQLLPEEQRAAAARYLVEDIQKRGWHLSTGFVGVGYLCPILSEMGYVDVAYRLLTNDTFPSWGYSIRHGATTIWERWDGWTEDRGFQDPGMNSFNHYSLGSVGQWLYQYVAGIAVDEEQPGYRHFLLKPYLDGELSYAQAEYNSINGKIVSHWQQDNDILDFHVVIPPNTSATVYLPATTREHVFEGNVPLSQAAGVTFVREESGRVVLEVGSGTYNFQAS